MLYPEEKERENRFKLALRMGLPVFALAVITVTSLLLRYFSQIPSSFAIVAFALLGIMVYYLFYLIYQGFNERVTDPISHVFTREYFTALMEREVKKRVYTLLLFSVENLSDINKKYGYINGDRVLYSIPRQLTNFLEERGLNRIPIAHFKGGDFIVALEGSQERYRQMMELIYVKFTHYSLDDIEVNLVSSMVDTAQTNDIEKLFDRLFELQNDNRKMLGAGDEEINPGTIETTVVRAIDSRSFSYRFQSAFDAQGPVLQEMSVKLLTPEGKLIHQKNFMPVINRLGLLRRFDEIQTEAALAAAERVDDGCKIAVDIAPSTLRNPAFIRYVQLLLSGKSFLKGRLVFLISEEGYYHQSESFNAQLQAFRRAGVCIALDRLGGLHSTLRYLHDLDVDMARFESYLGKGIALPKVQAITKGLHTAASEMGVKSWVRMVENAQELAIVKAIGIDLWQGNFLSPITSLKEKKE